MVEYRERLVDPLLSQLMTELPAVLIVGPRAAGKTTTAARHARTVVHLDREAEAVAFRADPDAVLRDLPEPVLLDEWQVVPGVLGALKRTVDADPRPGRFLVTGSVRADLEREGWPGTGRLVRIPLYGMTVRELEGRITGMPLIDRIEGGETMNLPQQIPDLRGYVDLALRGGFPEPALHLSQPTRERWLSSYVEQVLTRDAVQIEPRRDPARLRRYTEAYALNSAGLVDNRTLLDAAGIDRRTGIAYEHLLTNLMLVEQVPAWSSNRLRRLVLAPKRCLVDSALMAGILRLSAAAILSDGVLLGRLLDTFVLSQLRSEATVSSKLPRLYHLRQEHGRHEIDLLAELGPERIIAFEIKASSAPVRDDARHLAWLRERLGDRFVAGVVFHTGPRMFSLGDGITAMPICALWA